MAEIAVRNAYDASDYACLERCLRGIAGVTDLHLDRTRGVAHLSYDTSRTSPENIRSDVERLGYGCDCQPLRPHNRMLDILPSGARTVTRKMSTTFRLSTTLAQSVKRSTMRTPGLQRIMTHTPDTVRRWCGTRQNKAEPLLGGDLQRYRNSDRRRRALSFARRAAAT